LVRAIQKYGYMKLRNLLFVAAIMSSVPSFAQDDNSENENTGWNQNTIFKSGEMSHGGYGGVSVRMGQLNNESAIVMGGKGAWIINHKIGIGLAGSGIMGHSTYSSVGNIYTGYSGGYGGLLIEPIFFSDKMVHFSVPMVFGGGGVGKYVYNSNNFIGGDQYVAFAVFEPGLEVEFNMASWFRISAGAYYSFRSEIDAYLLTTDIVDPFNFGLTFKFGAF
jgi:hypothetical protein